MKRRTILSRAACLVAVLAGAALPLAAAAPQERTWTIDGVRRTALVYAPPPLPRGMGTAAKRPLVLAFHGHGGSARLASRSMRMQDVWPEAYVVYPQGLPTASPVDPRGRFPGWQREAGQLGDRDLKFVDAILKSLPTELPIDDQRVYAMGFSNGAYFTYLLWSSRGARFAGFAACAGALEPALHLTIPKPLVQVAGRADPLVPFADQRQAIETVRKLDGATGAGQACGAGCTLYPSAKNAPVLTLIHSGGHVFPPGASARIAKFFAEQGSH